MRTTDGARRGAAVTVAAVVLALAGGCTSADPGPPPADPGASGPAQAPPATAVVALGDSISVGFAACGSPSPCEEESWATGTDPRVASLRQRLAGVDGEGAGEEPLGANLAVPGARAADLAAQAAQVDLPGPGLVTVMVGANDVCTSSAATMTPPAAFRASIDAALAQVRSRAPQASVLVTSVPDVVAVAAGLEGEAVARATWARTRACRSVLDGAAPAEVSQRVDDLDRELVEACAAVEGCTHDGGAVSAWRPALDDLSEVDAFHPSVTGQAQLAEALWPAAQRALSAPGAAAAAG